MSVMALLFPIAGYRLAARKPDHTTAQLIAAATLGGGAAGVVSAIGRLMRGAGPENALAYAVAHLAFGAFVGVACVVVLAMGEKRRRKP